MAEERTSSGAMLASIAALGICAPFNSRSVIPRIEDTIRIRGIEADDALAEQVDV